MYETIFRSQSVRVGFYFTKLKALLTPQVVKYLGKVCLIFKTTLSSLPNKDDFSNGTLHIGFTIFHKGERAESTKL